MKLTGDQCLALAQIYPVLLLALVLELRLLNQAPTVWPARAIQLSFGVAGPAIIVAVLLCDGGVDGFAGTFLALTLVWLAMLLMVATVFTIQDQWLASQPHENRVRQPECNPVQRDRDQGQVDRDAEEEEGV